MLNCTSVYLRTELSGGPFVWRDSQKPTQILESLAELHQWDRPQFADAAQTGDLQLHVAGRTYRLSLIDGDCVKGTGRKEAHGRRRRVLPTRTFLYRTRASLYE